MTRRPRFQRQADDFKRGHVAPWPADGPTPAVIAARVTYVGNDIHKSYRSPTGRPLYGAKPDEAQCDHFDEAAWPRLQNLLRAAVEAPCVDRSFRGAFPARAWAYVNGVLHEARLTNQGNGQYHGFPLDYPEQAPHDPLGLLRNAPRASVPLHRV